MARVLMTDVTGRSFPELMEELVLAPAGMVRSTFAQPLPAERAAEAATADGGRGVVVMTNRGESGEFVGEVLRAVALDSAGGTG